MITGTLVYQFISYSASPQIDTKLFDIHLKREFHDYFSTAKTIQELIIQIWLCPIISKI